MSDAKLAKMQKDIDKKNKEISVLEKRLNKKNLIGQSSKSKFKEGSSIRDRYKKRKERLQNEIKQIKQDRIELKSNMKLKNRPRTQPKFDTTTGKAVNESGRDFENKSQQVSAATKQNNNNRKNNKTTSSSSKSSNAQAIKDAAAKRKKQKQNTVKNLKNSEQPFKPKTLVTQAADDDAVQIAKEGIANKKTVVDNLNKSVKEGKQTLKDNPQAKGVGGKRKAAEAMATLESQANKTAKDKNVTKNKKEGIGSRIARALSDTSNQEDSMDPDFNQKYHNLNKGGAVKKKYGMREGGFTKRGGMYKKGY
jgi:hypothetical protein